MHSCDNKSKTTREESRMKIDWKRKLSSRKFWAAVASAAISIFAAFGVDDLTSQQITAVISAVGSLVAYILAESYVDASKKDGE